MESFNNQPTTHTIAITEDSDSDFQSSEGSESGFKGAGTPEAKPHQETKPSSDVADISWYVDYSGIKAEPEDDSVELLLERNVPSKEPTFPIKLHMILASPEFTSIVSWLPHGRAFRIIQQKEFEEKVIPLYFRHGRLSSFCRQVSGWGFRRITSGVSTQTLLLDYAEEVPALSSSPSHNSLRATLVPTIMTSFFVLCLIYARG